jgi:hypothetical protein
MQTEKSRYNTKREYILLKDQILVKCYDTLYYSISINKNGDVISVDPDGGPYMCINRVITINNINYIVTKINKYEKIKDVLHILVDVIIKTT